MNIKMDDLFDKRSVVGAKLEALLAEKGYTKSRLCRECGISRPTLDKLLAGNITSKANFEKHMQKIFTALSMTPDALLGNVKNAYSRVREIRNTLNINQDVISRITSISPERLSEIEAGADVTIAELRDIALCLHTGTRYIENTSVFYPQMSVMEDVFRFSANGNAADLSGFWGHIGILPKSGKAYYWYPITLHYAKYVSKNMNNSRLVVPCMNNKLLFLNTDNIDGIVLLDKACDPPDFANWDPSVGEGEIPLVVYEALDDFYFAMESNGMSDEDVLSPMFMNYMKDIAKQYKWTEDDIFDLTSKIMIKYYDGNELINYTDFSCEDSLVGEIERVCVFGDDIHEKYIAFSDNNGADIMINTDNISLIELPLVKVEEAILQGYQKMMSE